MRGKAIHYGWIIVALGFLSVLGAHGFGRFAYSLVLRDMKLSLDLTYAQMGDIASANFIGYLALATIGGALASKYGSRRVISISAMVMGVTMILTGLSRSYFEVLVLRFLTGLGNGSTYLPSMALPSIWFALKYRGRATGYVSAGIGVGFALAGVLVPPILALYAPEGWRYVWFYLGSALIAISIVDLIFLRNRPEDLGLKPVGFEESTLSSSPSSSSSLRWGLVYKSKEVWFVGLVYFMYGFSYIIYVTFFAAYLEDVFGWSKALASSLWFMVGILSIFSGVIWGWVSDVLGRKYGMCLAYLVLASSYLLFAVALPPYGLYVSALVFGLTAWSIPTVAVVAAADYVSSELRSAAAGFVTFFFGVGQVLGPKVAGHVIDVIGFPPAFIIATLASLVGAFGSLLLKKPRKG